MATNKTNTKSPAANDLSTDAPYGAEEDNAQLFAGDEVDQITSSKPATPEKSLTLRPTKVYRVDPMKPVSFKVDAAVLQELDSRAAQQPGASRHTIARQIVLAGLNDAYQLQVLHEIAELREEVARLHRAMASAVVALLVQAGKIENPKEAEDWVRQVILP